MIDGTFKCSPYVETSGFTEIMMLSIDKNNYDKIKELLEKDRSHINHRNNLGWTALLIACRNSNTTSSHDIVELLLQYGADPNIPNNKCEYPIHSVIFNLYSDSNLMTLELLFKYKANPNVKTSNDDYVSDIILGCPFYIRDIIDIFKKYNISFDMSILPKRKLVQYIYSVHKVNVSFLVDYILNYTPYEIKREIFDDNMVYRILSCIDMNNGEKYAFLIDHFPDKVMYYDNFNSINCIYTHFPHIFGKLIHKLIFEDVFFKIVCDTMNAKTVKKTIIEKIPEQYLLVKLDPNNYGVKILRLSFELKHMDKIEVYNSMMSTSPEIADYLNIMDCNDMINKIKQYVDGLNNSNMDNKKIEYKNV